MYYFKVKFDKKVGNRFQSFPWERVTARTLPELRKKWMMIVRQDESNRYMKMRDIEGEVYQDGRKVGLMFANEMFGFGWEKLSGESVEVNPNGSLSKRKAWW